MKEPQITQTRGAFSMACGVEVNIRATDERIWNLLTDAKGFPRWNSTVTGIEGQIREGERSGSAFPAPAERSRLGSRVWCPTRG